MELKENTDDKSDYYVRVKSFVADLCACVRDTLADCCERNAEVSHFSKGHRTMFVCFSGG